MSSSLDLYWWGSSTQWCLLMRSRNIALFSLPFQDNRLERDDRPWDDRRQFMRYTTRVGQIGDDEPGHVRQCGDRAREILAGGLLEIKQDRQIIALAEFIPNRVQNDFSVRRETTQN